MPQRAAVSVTIIALNEQANLPRCLTSVGWADEIVVVDGGSVDATVAVAERLGARVLRREWTGYVDQKNFAVQQASHDWVLSLDADEWLSQAGGEEIQRVLQDPRAAGYALNRRSAFSGAFLKGGWSPDWQLRLFHKARGRFAGGHVHESVRLEPDSRVDRLAEPLQHHPYRSLSDYIQRLDRYTTLAAASLNESGRTVSWSRLLLSPPATFLKLYFLKRGYRDGVRGFLVAGGSAFYVLMKYGKLWEHTRPVDPVLDDRADPPARESQ